MVKCAKLQKDLPAMPYKPFQNELGQRVFDEISEEGWKMWLEHSKMVVNEYRLDLTSKDAHKILARRLPRYDKAGEEHFNLISALHKSLRGSDVQAGLYWLARMLEGGEDPLYIARRLVRFASEDVGAADPQALPLTVAAKDAVHFKLVEPISQQGLHGLSVGLGVPELPEEHEPC